jgi:group I intron endonuclease
MPEKILALSGVYAIRNSVNNKQYIGSSVCLRKRRSEHFSQLKCNCHGNRKLQNAWNKYCARSFVFEILEIVDDRNELIVREQFWIDKTNAVDFGYNILPKAYSALGIKHGPPSEATKRKISESYKKNITEEFRAKQAIKSTGVIFSPERRAKIAAARKLQIMKPRTPETKAKIAAANTGKRHSLETIALLCSKRHSEETKAKISALQVGKKLSDKTKAKMSASAKAWRTEKRLEERKRND